MLSSTRAVRAMACSNHYFPGPHTWRAQSPAVPSPPPSSHVFTLQLCSRNGGEKFLRDKISPST